MDICLTTDRMTMRPVRQSDLPRLVEQIGDWDVAKMLAQVPYPYGPADGDAWFSGITADGTRERYIFALDAGEGLIGVVGFTESAEDDDKGPEFGYWLAKTFWGKGLMSEAAKAAIDWRFAATDCMTVNSGAFEENLASKRILEKIGFETIGCWPAYCRARDKRLPHFNLRLTRDRYTALAKQGARDGG